MLAIWLSLFAANVALAALVLAYRANRRVSLQEDLVARAAQQLQQRLADKGGFCNYGVGPAGPPICTAPVAFVVRRLLGGELQRRTVCAEHVHGYVTSYGWELES